MNGKSLQSEDNTAPSVTVSIVSHGDSKKVMHLLESMHTFEQANSIQVIVTDNLGYEIPVIDDSTWSSLNILRNERSWGFARNHNHAFRLVKGKYFCILNPDVVFVEDVFIFLIQQIESLKADIVAPLIVDSHGVIQDSYRDLPTPGELIRRRFPGYKPKPASSDKNGVIDPDWLSGIFLLMRSETYQEMGGLNEKYRLYFEDVEFCTRARLAGLNILVDTSVRIQHDAHRASRRKPIYLLWHIQSAIRFFISPVYKEAFRRSRLS